MKRQCCFCIAILLVMVSLLAALPLQAQAQADLAFATLNYVMDPAEGEETGKKAHVADKMEFERAVTITWRLEEADLLLEGEPVEGDSLRLETAGMYRLTVKKKNAGDTKSYEVYVLPNINLKADEVFTRYPEIKCTNALEMILDQATEAQVKNFQSGDPVRGLGKHTLTVKGFNKAWDYNFYIKVCSVKTVYNEELGKYALALTVGQFDDIETTVTLDAKTQLPAGEVYYETAVGPHILSATVDKLALSNLHALPASDQLILRPEFYITEKEISKPVTLMLSRYDGNFCVLVNYDEATGEYDRMEPIEGDYRTERDGCHAVVALDEKGEIIPYVFLVHANENDKGTTTDRIVMTFNNPHNTYAIILIPLAAVMLGAVAWFFVKRRGIV